MPTQQQMKEFLQSKGKWDDYFNRPASDYKDALYPDGKYAGPVPDYDNAEQVKAEAAKLPVTEEAWKLANALAEIPAPVTDVPKWQEDFTARAARLDFEVQWADHGRIVIYQRASDLLPRAPFLEFHDTGSAGLWLAGTERERAVSKADSETLAGKPAWGATKVIDLSPAGEPVSRGEFNDLLSKFGVVSAQLATILEMLKERPVPAGNQVSRGIPDGGQFGIES